MEQLKTERLLLLRLDIPWLERFAADSKQAGKDLESALGYPESGRTEHPVTTYQYAEKLYGNIRRLLIASCKTAKENTK